MIKATPHDGRPLVAGPTTPKPPQLKPWVADTALLIPESKRPEAEQERSANCFQLTSCLLNKLVIHQWGMTSGAAERRAGPRWGWGGGGITSGTASTPVAR